jgi:hypothetical protein
MAIFQKARSDNSHLQSLNSAKYRHLDGTDTTPITIIPASKGGSLLRVVLNTNGNAVLLRNGSRPIATIASDAPETTFNYGVWCENGLIAECAGPVSVTIVFDS